jgi:8-oxo-dGTP pyrophosphatase MutT (NUDIX family)
MPNLKTSNCGKLHYSVGAIIEKNQKFFLINRATPPEGWASIAGHVDEGENETLALAREIKEEAGLQLRKYRQIFEEEISGNTCSRGISNHYWYVFLCEVEGEPLINPDEVKSSGWFSPNEIKRLKLEPVWHYWFKKLAII